MCWSLSWKMWSRSYLSRWSASNRREARQLQKMQILCLVMTYWRLSCPWLQMKKMATPMFKRKWSPMSMEAAMMAHLNKKLNKMSTNHERHINIINTNPATTLSTDLSKSGLKWPISPNLSPKIIWDALSKNPWTTKSRIFPKIKWVRVSGRRGRGSRSSRWARLRCCRGMWCRCLRWTLEWLNQCQVFNHARWIQLRGLPSCRMKVFSSRRIAY